MRTTLFLSAAALLVAAPALAAASGSASGQGTLEKGRTFSVSAKIEADGTASGRATLINRAFSGDSGKGPYQLQVDISCGKLLDDHTAIFGGTTRRTNDSNLVDAVYFSVQDNGEPGKGKDMISRAYFFDDDPSTTGDPALCLGSTLTDLPLETIESGNIQVRSSM
ncbi:MAG TPA: hypothetical protein VM055_04220 [Novosphingobium sp.]|nr:hypothetical protein [Novosphingobium sp.]